MYSNEVARSISSWNTCVFFTTGGVLLDNQDISDMIKGVRPDRQGYHFFIVRILDR